MATKIPKAAPSAHLADGILKPKKDNIARKNVAAKVHKGVPLTRNGQQAELRDQNQLLVATNEDLQKNLSETQQRVDELEQQFSELEKENTDMKKSLNDCHVALIAAKIDPVLGETVGENAQKEDQRREVQNVSKDLLNELKTFGDMASTQRVQLEAINTTIKDLTEARLSLMQEREMFSQEAAEMEQALEEAEGLLA